MDRWIAITVATCMKKSKRINAVVGSPTISLLFSILSHISHVSIPRCLLRQRYAFIVNEYIYIYFMPRLFCRVFSLLVATIPLSPVPLCL